jgi:branched-chain amino acid aminotransferase
MRKDPRRKLRFSNPETRQRMITNDAMIHRFVLHNGRICSSTDNVLGPGQLGLLAGWGVFTTIRVTDGVLFAWDRHWSRMTHDAALMHVPMPEPAAVQKDLIRLVEANGKPTCTLRLVVIRNGGGLWEGPARGTACDVVAMTADLKDWGDSARLGVQPHGRHAASEFAGAKINSWAVNLTWLENAQRRGFDEVILLNERGEVSELTSANIFIATGGDVWTPPLSSGCLPGVTRELLLSEVQAPGFQVRERTLYVDDLFQADEVFITSSTRDLLAVAEVDGRVVSRKGNAMAALRSAFRGYIDSYVRTHAQEGTPVS